MSVGLAAGVLLGLLTQIGQGALPDDAAALLTNSGGAWLVAAFAVGALTSSAERAATAGAVTLVAASFTFYVAVDLFEVGGSGHVSALVWAMVGLVAGPIFAVAGHHARDVSRHRPMALALVAGALVAEAMHFMWWVGVDSLHGVAVVELIVGLVVLVVALRLAAQRDWPVVLGVAAAAWLAERIAVEGAGWLLGQL